LKTLLKIFPFFSPSPLERAGVRFVLALLFALALSPAHAQTTSSLLWATYFGGDSETVDGGIVTDDSGNIYMAGYTYSDSGIATSGAYQTSNGGYTDVYLAKFTSSGKLLWSTYFCGSGYNYGGAVAIDKLGNVYIDGNTESPSGVATSGAYKTSPGAIFLAKFTSSGHLLWATYYGDSDDDESGAIITDSSGNVYMAGQTYSDSGIATSSAHQTSNAGNGDCFLAKFSPSGSLLWGTYFGGKKNDAADALVIDKTGNLYMSGYTQSDSGIATSGAYLTAFREGFLAKFNLSGTLLWATYYGGVGDGIACDNTGNIYISGTTQSTVGIATSGAYQTSFGGMPFYGDAFLAKFSPSDSLLWATYFGINNQAGNVVTDRSGNVYIGGFTGNNSMITTSGAYQSYNAGGYDAFLVQFSPKDSLLASTYFGGYFSDFGNEIAIDKSGNIYIDGNTYSYNGIATSGAYQVSLVGSDDAFIAKFHIYDDYDDVGLSSIISPKGSFCTDSMPVKVQLKNYGPDTMKSVKINWEINSRPQTIYIWTGSLLSGNSDDIVLEGYNFKPGIDTIKAWTVPIGFFDTVPGNDTARIIDTVNALPDALFNHTVAGDTVKFSPINNSYSKYSWSFGDGNTSDSVSPSHVYAGNGTYTVSLTITDKNGCTATYKTTDTVNYTGIPVLNGQGIELKISPNPFSSNFNIGYNLLSNSHTTATIYDMTGKEVAVLLDENQTAGNYRYSLQTENYRPGIYLLKIEIDNEVITQKIVKIN